MKTHKIVSEPNSAIKLALALPVLASTSLSAQTSSQALKNDEALKPHNRPNIVVLFVDDLGWTSLGYQDKTFHTPNIDALQKQGTYFSRAYVSTATSSPSRASLYTGKQAVRCGFVRHIPDNPDRLEYNYWTTDPGDMPSRNWMKLDEITFAERLHEIGYYNYFIGKWHLGHAPYFPIHQGWDAQYGSGEYGHPGSYIAPFFKKDNPIPEFHNKEYLTDVLTDEAVRFIKKEKHTQPFLLNLSYYTVHSPHQGRPDLVAKYKKEGLTGEFLKFAAMVTALDESVGRVRKALEESGLADNTIIVFASDQGGMFYNTPLRGGKIGGDTLAEGGCRIPLIIYNPLLPNAAKSCSTPVMTYDIYPTILEFAEGFPCRDRQIDGVSLIPLMKGKTIADRDLFMIRSYEDQNDAIIHGDYKLIKYRSGKLQLYNVKQDISETHNLVDEMPDKCNEMLMRLDRWEREDIPGELLRNQHDRGNWGGPDLSKPIKKKSPLPRPAPIY
ncbi:MAG: sulfatase [Bacteroidales bacterium]